MHMLLLAVGKWRTELVTVHNSPANSQPIKEYRSSGCWWRWRWSNIVIYLILYGTFIIKFNFWIPVQIHLHTLNMVCSAPNFGISQQSNSWIRICPEQKILSNSLINDKHHPSMRLILFFFAFFSLSSIILGSIVPSSCVYIRKGFFPFRFPCNIHEIYWKIDEHAWMLRYLYRNEHCPRVLFGTKWNTMDESNERNNNNIKNKTNSNASPITIWIHVFFLPIFFSSFHSPCQYLPSSSSASSKMRSELGLVS